MRANRSIGWGVADQAVSSLTNFGLGLAVARAVTPHDFGRFSVTFSAYLVALGISRAFATDPLIAKYSGSLTTEWRSAVEKSSGTALLVGLVLGALSVALATLLVSFRLPLILLGAALPGLLLQDSYRVGFFASSRPDKAFWNDVVWFAGLLAGVLTLTLFWEPALSGLLFAWGAAGTIAGLTGAFQMRLWPKVRYARHWFVSNRDLGPRYCGEFLLGAGGSQLSIFGVGAVAGLPAAGALRGAQILLGAVNVVFQGIQSTQTPEAVKLANRDINSLNARSKLLSLGLASVAAAWTIAVLVIPDDVGMLLMGSNWHGASSVLLPVGIAMSGAGVVAGAVIGLRGMGAAPYSVRAQAVAAPSTLILIVGGAFIGGARGAAIGMAFAGIFASAVWWKEFRRAIRDRKVSGSRLDRPNRSADRLYEAPNASNSVTE